MTQANRLRPKGLGIRPFIDWYRAQRALENVVIYDEDRKRVWRAALPRSELLGNIDPRCRYVRPNALPEIAGATIFGLVGWVTASAFWYLLIPVFVFDAIMGFGFGMVLVGPGWLLGPLWGPRPHWIVRKEHGELRPIINMMAVNSELGAEPTRTSVEERSSGVNVITSGLLYETTEMRDEADLVTQGMSRWQKVAVSGVITLLGSMVLALFFFGVVFTADGA